jgi:HEAT repeat protein
MKIRIRKMIKMTSLLAATGLVVAAQEFPKFEFEYQADHIAAQVKAQTKIAVEMAQAQAQAAAQANAQSDAIRAKVEAAMARSMSRGREDDMYRRASRLVDERKYEEALKQYQYVVDAKGNRIEGALYWKAYVLAKLGRRDEAMKSLDELKKGYASSRWLNDAKALELEIQQSGGRAASPESESDEELKLLAINGLLSTDPERAVPLLEKQLNNPKNSPKMKERALFVLAQSKNARGREIVGNYAKGATNPDLQSLAIQYMGSFGGKENRDKLAEIYRSVSEVQLKRAVLRGLMMARDQEYLLQIAKSEQNPELQREAIRYAGNAGADVSALWSANASKEIKEAVLEGLMNRNNVEKLAEIAKSDSDPKVRREAIQYIGNIDRERSGNTLQTLYASEQDKQVKSTILRAFRNQNNVKALIEAARKESDVSLKRDAVRMLSDMKSPEATEFLVELLNK